MAGIPRENQIYCWMAVFWTGAAGIRIEKIIGSKTANARKKFVVLLLFLCLVLGFCRGWSFQYGLGQTGEKIARAVERKTRVTITGEILSRKESEKSLQLVLKNSSGRYLIQITEEPEKIQWIPGQRLQVTGTFVEMKAASNPGGYHEKKVRTGEGIRGKMKNPVCHPDEDLPISNHLRLRLYLLQQKMGHEISRYVATPYDSVLKAMLLGDRGELDSRMQMIYQKSGTAHILSISGLHVALLMGTVRKILMMILRRRGVSQKKAAGVLALIILWLYGMMTGFSTSTLRAVVMLSMGEIAGFLDRKADLLTNMGEALLIVSLLRPESVLSPGTVLSFLAVFAVFLSGEIYRISFGNQSFRKYPEWLRPWLKGMIQTLLLSGILNVLLMPVLLLCYYEIPVWSQLLNFCIVPTLSITVGMGMLTAVLGMVPITPFFMAAHFTGKTVEWLLRRYEDLALLSLRLPFSRINPGVPEVWLVLLFFLLLAMELFVFLSRKSRPRHILTFALMWFLSAGAFLTGTGVCHQFAGRICFLDVGQGDGSLIHLPGGGNYLIDGGSSSQKETGRYTILPTLKYYGMSELDAVFISHTDLDHISGILELLENRELYGVTIRRLVFAEGTVPEENYACLITAAKKAGTEILFLAEGEVVRDRGVPVFEALYPAGNEPCEHRGNDYSLVLRFQWKKTCVYYCGDISQEAEARILESGQLNTFRRSASRVILKVPHHGSKYSSSGEFLQDIDADLGIISCGENNRYGHPAPETLERLSQAGVSVHRTDRQGAAVISLE